MLAVHRVFAARGFASHCETHVDIRAGDGGNEMDQDAVTLLREIRDELKVLVRVAEKIEAVERSERKAETRQSEMSARAFGTAPEESD